MKNLVQTDALNRAFRTFIQFCVIGVIVDVIPTVMSALDTNTVDSDQLWRSGLRAFLGGVLAFMMRYKWSPSDSPPPTPVVETEEEIKALYSATGRRLK